MSAFHTQRPEDAPLWLCFQMTLLHVNRIFKVFQKKKKRKAKNLPEIPLHSTRPMGSTKHGALRIQNASDVVMLDLGSKKKPRTTSNQGW